MQKFILLLFIFSSHLSLAQSSFEDIESKKDQKILLAKLSGIKAVQEYSSLSKLKRIIPLDPPLT